MKRSEVQAKIADNVLINFMPSVSLQTRMLIADSILCEIEKCRLYLVDEEYGVTGYEPEEGWDAWLENQKKKEEARDFEVIENNNTRSKDIAQKFLDGKSFEELSTEYNVTRERIVNIINKERRLYEKSKA